ncbi:DUF1800 domain-containing protein [Wenyingzhuangia marina]|uniref:DUF1800 domain-containing protein n=1 Tax=Wenyingzhuangia marina TaxID=1195760 RepID=A0A1M5WN50_9FLAO|nr:DUF1800 domain-containing protein [Wenyingzhuangia marina]GGF79450.1 hypothetical protein GCM10011397_23120 [Wenyingzhuangia marina]SHH88918.1 Protein of unknown function [Wenyingzhuangia marina]
MKNKHIIHLYNRVGFGILPQNLDKLSRFSMKENVNYLFKKSKTITPIIVDTSKLENIKSLDKNDEKKRMLQKENRRLLANLNSEWYYQLNHSTELLRDKMTLFWANHFVCAENDVLQTQQYLLVLKKNALGNFRDFVLEISKTPMMIKYLNNQQNRKENPNENYARELMELFTLGNGHYTETDIKESARAFTGWSSNKTTFIFRAKHHDFGSKTFLGKTGTFNGTDIIDIILEQPQCALFISKKIYKEFVNPTPNQEHITQMANVFRKNYDISDLMEFVLTSDWFYEDKNIGVKIKSPVELLVGIQKVIPYTFNKTKYFQYLQFNLGQKLLYPPNVAGWPGNKQWIDANTIMLRLKLTSTIAQQKEIELEPEVAFEDDFETFNKRKNNKNKLLFTTVDWQEFNQQIKNTNATDWQEVLIGSSLNQNTVDFIKKINTNNIKEFCIALMSLPEYQMC